MRRTTVTKVKNDIHNLETDIEAVTQAKKSALTAVKLE